MTTRRHGKALSHRQAKWIDARHAESFGLGPFRCHASGRLSDGFFDEFQDFFGVKGLGKVSNRIPDGQMA